MPPGNYFGQRSPSFWVLHYEKSKVDQDLGPPSGIYWLPTEDMSWLLPTRQQWRTWSYPSKATFVGAVTGVIGAIGVLWAVLPARPVPDPAQLRLEGSISSLLAGTNTLLLQVETLSEVAGSKAQDSRADPAIIGKQPVVYDNTDALRRLADDGDLFRHLSEPLQHRLPRFIQTRVNIISALNSLRPDLNQGGSIKLLRLTLRAEEKCFESELQFQHGRIDAERNKMNIEAIMDDELRELVGPGQKIPPGTELGPMMPVFVPDSKSKGK